MVTASEIKPQGPHGFDPLAEQGEGQFFYPSESTVVQTCGCDSCIVLWVIDCCWFCLFAIRLFLVHAIEICRAAAIHIIIMSGSCK